MAEAFARTYGDDVLIAASAGVAPGFSVARNTLRAMDEKNIEMREHFPKGFRDLGRAEFDLVFNMSGAYLPSVFGEAKVTDWDVPDPVAMDFKEHCDVRDAIERRVMTLILDLSVRPSPNSRSGQTVCPCKPAKLLLSPGSCRRLLMHAMR
jgi:protein-tyrosine-phosphatase